MGLSDRTERAPAAYYAALERLAEAARGYARAAFEQPLDSPAAADRVDFWRGELLAALRAEQRARRAALRGAGVLPRRRAPGAG